ncbi:MAG: YlbF family regulator [Bacilli bacterium]|nr:YlbF family regulator [Bacilli bacterium]
MKEEVNLILNKLDNTDEIKRLKELNKSLNNNEEYLSLMNEFTSNKDNYIKNNTYNEELLLLRKKLFSINELNEYLKIQNNLRLLFTKINNVILSIVD